MRDALRVGIGVFNAGDHRLARDAWEAPRVEGDEGTCDGGPPDEQLLDGLAQYAAAVDHARRREWSGCVDLAERGARSLREIDGDHRGVNVAEVCAFLRRLAADPEFAERRRPLALRHGGDAVTPIDLSFENAATAADLTGLDLPTATRGCVTQHFSLPRTQHLDAGRRLILNAEDARPNHVALLSAVADSYTPAGTQLLSATFLGEPDESAEALASSVREAMASWYPENSFADLELLETHRIPTAQLVQAPGFQASVPAPDAPEGPVALAGDYTRWSSIQGALESGRRAERALLDGAD